MFLAVPAVVQLVVFLVPLAYSVDIHNNESSPFFHHSDFCNKLNGFLVSVILLRKPFYEPNIICFMY